MGDNRTVVEQYIQAMGSNDIEAQERLLSDDYEERYPQSGECIVGKDNRRAIMENYPGGTPQIESERRASPPPPQITGAGDTFTAAGQVTYPNGETWHVVSLFELADGKIRRQTTYFAQPFEAPAWRAPYVKLEATEARSR